jgi:hypothetical protein
MREMRPKTKAVASDATALARTTSIVRDAGVVLDGDDLEAIGLKGGDRGFTTGAGASDVNFDLTHAHALDLVRAAFAGTSGGERGGLARPLEPDGSG